MGLRSEGPGSGVDDSLVPSPVVDIDRHTPGSVSFRPPCRLPSQTPKVSGVEDPSPPRDSYLPTLSYTPPFSFLTRSVSSSFLPGPVTRYDTDEV